MILVGFPHEKDRLAEVGSPTIGEFGHLPQIIESYYRRRFIRVVGKESNLDITFGVLKLYNSVDEIITLTR